MKRLVEKQVLEWKNSARRKPLVLRGARQVGKTWLAVNILGKQFERCIKIDLEKRRDLHALFQGSLDPKEIVEGLEISEGRILPGKCLLFFDEIQACPRAIMALRYFYEDMPELHVIAAGSLLEFAFSDISVPVGRLQYLEIFPMTFYEYLLALGKEPMAEHTLTSDKAVSEPIRKLILNELKKYFFIGGMPECVRTYRESGSMVEVFQVQSEILDAYRDDFSKYGARVDSVCLDAVLLNVARSIGEQLKYTRLNEGVSYQLNHKAFDLLVKARVVHKISACNPSGLPLGATANPKKFKACLSDIGLMQRLCKVPVELEMKQDNLLSLYRGRLAEQFVAQELLAWQNSELYYWARDARGSSAEIDYLTVRDGLIYPVEVKSGSGGSMKSLHLMLKQYPNCPAGLVLHGGPYGEMPEQKLVFMPIYGAATAGDLREYYRDAVDKIRGI
ncbi:MAG: DUF4143 domain-containing protein [Geobacter sp.]|nr:MAG: DUF4143 domain-containing protein [Geobacter sp.]